MRKLLIAAGVLAVAIAASAWMLIHRVETAERAWAQSFGPLSAIPQRVQTEENITMRGLTSWMARIGPGDNDVLHAVLEYGRQQNLSPTHLERPNAVVQRYVRTHAADRDRFADWIAKNPPPMWSLRLTAATDDFPNLTHFLRIHRVLLSRRDGASGGRR